MLSLAVLTASNSARAETPLTIAVAANVQPAFAELAEQFHRQTGLLAQGSFAATGKLAGQIIQGAPFHLLLAADNAYPEKLHQQGLTLQPPRRYAHGVLVIWTTRALPLDNWPHLLQSAQIQRIAIANPDAAPYGREAVRVLQQHQLLRLLQDKLVYGESIGQTNQFISTGAADIGFTAKSTVVRNATGTWRELPADSYRPIIQSAVLLKYAADHERAAAERFFQFLFSPAAAAILEKYGYQLPGPTASASNASAPNADIAKP